MLTLAYCGIEGCDALCGIIVRNRLTFQTVRHYARTPDGKDWVLHESQPVTAQVDEPWTLGNRPTQEQLTEAVKPILEKYKKPPRGTPP